MFSALTLYQRWNLGGHQISHGHQVVGGAREGKHPIHFQLPAMPHLAQQRDRLQPAETFVDALPFLLAAAVARALRGAPVNGAAAPRQVCRHKTSDFDSITDAMELSVDNLSNAHKSTVLNLRSALAPVISSVDTSKQTASGRNLLFVNMRVGDQGNNISLSCSATGGECMLPKLPTNQHDYLYFVSANNQLLSWLQPTASGSTFPKGRRARPPKAAPAAGAAPVSPNPAAASAPKIIVIQ
jgi:hypothetical protein